MEVGGCVEAILYDRGTWSQGYYNGFTPHNHVVKSYNNHACTAPCFKHELIVCC